MACFICLNFFYSLSFMFENEHCSKVVPYRRASVHIKPGLMMYCMNPKASCNYIVKGCGNFPRIFYINKLFVHSINLQRFKATVCVKGKTENFGWQNASLMPRELSYRYINIRELICLYWRDSSSQKHILGWNILMCSCIQPLSGNKMTGVGWLGWFGRPGTSSVCAQVALQFIAGRRLCASFVLLLVL